MKAINLISKLLLIILFYSCSSKTNRKFGDSTVRDTERIVRNIDSLGHPIDFDNTKIIDTLYVTDRQGTEMKQRAEIQSTNLGRYKYGEQLEVIEILNGWLGVRDRIHRVYKNRHERIAWEEVYVQSNSTGKLSDIHLIQHDLNVINSITINNRSQEYPEGHFLNEYLKLELVDKSMFDEQTSNAVNYLVQDTTNIVKKNGTIELPYDNKKIKRYTDKPDEEETSQIFTYIGNIPFLNKYVLTGSYYEGSDYKLVDNVTGDELSLGDYPYISPDKKYLVWISANPYENTADFGLYTINGKNVKQLMVTSFMNWVPVTEEKLTIFWSSDNYIYVPVLPSTTFQAPSGKWNYKNFQYLRIKVL